ncbi:MAG TPA: carboxypeptidase-like regulatory domain-containing protein [Candidatus Limnocylindrales bacterium]|nr:carboxypeptidase-like regulatory domain-containing protein [Candidatus Limnocylindrales bacterium]
MKAGLLALAAACCAHAAVLKGMVVESQTGHALARALIVVRPVAGSRGGTQSTRTNSLGEFAFKSIVAGSYTVLASKIGFAPVEYGQRKYKAPGVPVSIEEGSERELRIVLPRLGAITGRVADENDVGLAEHVVYAYRATHPPRLVGHAETDDRGMFRIAELEPGAYLVRTGPKQYDDGAYLPTFYRDVLAADSARPIEVGIDRDAGDIVIRPMPGGLLTLAGRVDYPAVVTLSSDMGAQSMITGPDDVFHFEHLAPGKYHVMAETSDKWVAFQEIDLMRDRGDLRLRCSPMPLVAFHFEGAADGVQVIARRVELWGEAKPEFLTLKDNGTRMMPGQWEFSLAPNSSWYVAKVEAPVAIVPPGADVKFVLSTNPASIHGTVSGASAGAPVLLEHDGEIRTTRADLNGAYQFVGLGPGVYRLLASFDIDDPRASNGAVAIDVAEGAAVSRDLSLK